MIWYVEVQYINYYFTMNICLVLATVPSIHHLAYGSFGLFSTQSCSNVHLAIEKNDAAMSERRNLQCSTAVSPPR